MGQQVEVYFNLRKSTFSVRRGGRVVSHADRVLLRDCTFVVQPAGLRKVRETGVKNVHAFVRGTLHEDTVEHRMQHLGAEHPKRVRYNPFIFDTFVTQEDGREEGVHKAHLVLCEIVIDHCPLMWAWWPR